MIEKKINQYFNQNPQNDVNISSLLECNTGNIIPALYSKEFKQILINRKWSSVSEGDCIESFPNFEDLLSFVSISINLKNHTYFLSEIP